VKTGQVRRRRARKRRELPAPLPASTLTEDAYRLIKWRITTVQLAPGTKFTEPELAESLDMSRTPVREALLLLRTQGLVAVEGRSGYRVSPVTLRDVHDLASVRRLLEGEAAFLAAPHFMEAGEFATLKARVPPPLDHVEPTSTPSWIEADRRFHLALAVTTGNRHLVDALEPVLEKSARLMHLVVALDSPASEITHGHDDLLSAIGSHDKERARQLIIKKICDLEDAVARALTSSESLLSANVVVERPQNQFYLDVTTAELVGLNGYEPSLPHRPRAEPVGKSRTSTAVKP